MPTITSVQIRGARGMLDWSMTDLGEAAGLSVSTVKRMEVESLQPVSSQSYAQVQAAFEAAGVRFLAPDGKGVGLRYRPR